MNELEKFRKEKDQFYATGPQSPLTAKQKKDFSGLKYFPENPALRLELPVEEYPDREEIEIQTSTGDIQVYTRYGKLRFSVEGQPVELTLFYNEGYYFLPFADSLAGTETYGAGRYLEPEPLGDGCFLLDFNYAYNPYCAYNENWSCPITPRENRLKVPIRAGEKNFHE
jgi:uncharacterized protein